MRGTPTLSRNVTSSAQARVAAIQQVVGDLVILSYKGESVWWYERGRYEQGYYGHHGGLTREEMETVLLARQL